jgi:phosphomannomutase
MAERLIITISGMRGIVGENLTPTIAAEYGSAFGTFLKAQAGFVLRSTCYGEGGENNKTSIVMGRDSRPSGQMLASAVAAGLCAVGVDVVDLSIVTTPGVAVMVKDRKCEGGIVVTASHNPIQYNGIKLLLGSGGALPSNVAEQVKRAFFEKRFSFVNSRSCGQVITNDLTDDTHIDKILTIVDRKAIAAKQFKVVVDSVNGAGGRITKKLLSRLGCKVTAINDAPTGLFAHQPEPTIDNVTELCDVVKNEQADIGFAQDPDADRLAIVDETGRYIGEEYTLALAVKYVLSKQSGRIATNLSTSRMVDDIAKAANGEVIRTPVGEANVTAAMLENNCVIGGEGNGGVIDLRVSPVRDSLIGIAMVLQSMAETEKKISQLVGEIGGYYMVKEKFEVGQAEAKRILDLAKKKFTNARVDTRDGCRFDFENGWVHLRASNTEPVIRAIVESKDERTVQKYIDIILKIRNEVLS